MRFVAAAVVVTLLSTAAPAEEILPHPRGCPRIAFCGCGVALKVFGELRKDLWRASAWFRFPRAHASAGMVAVRRHHVFYIESVYPDGTVLAYDPNSGGHLTRRHRVSLSGYRVVDPNGGPHKYSFLPTRQSATVP